MMTDAEIKEKYGPFPEPTICNGHGDYGPHIPDCELCLKGIPHEHKYKPITKDYIIFKLFKYVIDEYAKKKKSAN